MKLIGVNALNFPENLYIETINNDDRDYDNIEIVLYAQVGSTSIKSDETSFNLFIFSDCGPPNVNLKTLQRSFRNRFGLFIDRVF